MSFAARERSPLRAGERGQTAPLMMLMMMLCVVGGVMVIDVGLALGERRAAQAAVDFAALAAAQELPNDPLDPQLSVKIAAAQTTAADYLRRNGYDPDDFEVNATITAPYDGDVQAISIEIARPHHWLIGRVFGLDEAMIGARAVAHADPQPRDIVVVLDRSGSMCDITHPSGSCPNPPGDPDGNGIADWQPFDQMRDAARGFTDNFTPFISGEAHDLMGLVSYSSTATVDQALTTDFGVGSSYETAIDAMTPSGRTNIGHALYLARTELDVAPARGAQQIIVLLSDGRANRYLNGGTWASPKFTNCDEDDDDDCSQADSDAVQQATLAAQSGAAIYTIGLTEDAGTALLQQIADIGLSQGAGGQFFSVEDPDDLDEVFTQIAALVGFALSE